MGQEIVYCFRCQTRLMTADFSKGHAVRHGNRVACADCAPELLRTLSPAELKEFFEKRGKAGPATPRMSPSGALPTRRAPAVRPAPRARGRLAWAAAAAGVAVLLTAVLLPRGGGVPPQPPPPSERAALPPKAASVPDPLEATRALLQEIGGLDVQARPLLAAEKFGEAVHVYEAARGRHAAEDWKAMLDGKSDEVRREARRLLPALREAAAEARRSGRPDDLRLARDRVARWGLPSLLQELETALSSVPEERPWRELFDGRSVDFLTEPSRPGWRVEEGLLARSGVDNAAQTRESFGDGEFRFRFEARGLNILAFHFRQGSPGHFWVEFARNVTETWDSSKKELFVRLSGTNASATLDGQPVAVKLHGSPGPEGRLQFNGRGASLRFHSISFRPLDAAPRAEPLALRPRDARISGEKIFTTGAGDEHAIEGIGLDARIAWTVDIPQAGRYRVDLDSACPHNNGGRFALHLGSARLESASRITGSWKKFQVWSLGTLDLPKGPLEVRLEPIESKGGLLNLRSVRLEPQ